VQAFKIAGMSVFQDILDLGPGERWEKALYGEIDRCDVFLLFWSRAAAASEWVSKEIDCSLGHPHGGRASYRDCRAGLTASRMIHSPGIWTLAGGASGLITLSGSRMRSTLR
jgi:hypothetical protein